MYRSLTAAAVVLACAPAAGAGPYDDLLKHSSPNTNALVLIDVKGASASALAKREKWAEKVQQSGHGGLGFFPPDAELVAIAGEVNFTTMNRDFQVGFVKVRNLPNFKTLAAREGGTMDEIAGQLTVISPREVYFTSFPGGTLAAVYPVDRQYVSRWLRANRAGKLPPLAPYLRAAADAAGDSTVTIALDLEDVMDPAILRFGLGVSPVLAKYKDANLFALSMFLSRVKGLTFSAKVAETVTGQIVVAFPEGVNRYKGVLKDLFLEVIDGHGISLTGLEKWDATFTDKTMTLSGSMSGDDLKRLVSLFAFPRPELQDAPAGAAGDAPTAGGTQRYMAAVGAILADIKRVKDSSNYNKTATWHDNAAGQLEQLSRRNVDPAAVDAAYQAARGLRSIAASLRGVPIDVNAAAAKGYAYTQRVPYSGWGWYPGGWWGGYRALAFAPQELRTNIPEVQGEMAKVVAEDQKRRIATWTKIDQTMSEVRRKLEDKYKANF